jgi:hypothetical protein
LKLLPKHLSFGRYRGTLIHKLPADYCRHLVSSPLYFFLSEDEIDALALAGYRRDFETPTNTLPQSTPTEKDSPTAAALKNAYNSYCEFIAHGFPPTAWSYVSHKTSPPFSVTSKTLFVRAEREGIELPQDQLNVAKALSLQERLLAVKAGSPDKRTEAVWLSTVKTIEGLYFGRDSATEKDVSILSAMIDRELE